MGEEVAACSLQPSKRGGGAGASPGVLRRRDRWLRRAGAQAGRRRIPRRIL